MAEIDFKTARFNMVEQQVRTWEVLDPRVLELMLELPREDFVPPAFKALACADISVSLPQEQVMMPPKVAGRLVQALQLQPQERVLEIGTGSGYVTALMASLAGHVESVDIHAELTQKAIENLKSCHLNNVDCVTGDAINGWNTERQYDAIVLTGSLPILEEHFQKQLNIGGRLFVIVGEQPIMTAHLITRISENEWLQDELFETVIPALQGATVPERFVL